MVTIKGFKLNKDGDVVINNGLVAIVDGNKLLRQTVETVLGTNNGEWRLNPDEGINFDYIITKSPDFDVIRSEIIGGLLQVDSSFVLDDYSYNFDKNKRTLNITFKATSKTGTISGNYSYI